MLRRSNIWLTRRRWITIDGERRIKTRTVEFDAAGKVVWRVSNDDLPEKPFDDACGAQRLPNGNTVIASHHAKGDKIKLFEVTPDKKLVWQYAGKHSAHEFQILTTNGKPLEGKPLK